VDDDDDYILFPSDNAHFQLSAFMNKLKSATRWLWTF